MSMTPNTSVSPAASRNSISPNCSPLRSCSRTRMLLTAGWGRGACAGSVLHPAVLHVGIAAVAQDRVAERFVDQPALAVVADGAHVVVLDRVVVGVELEGPAHRIESRRLQGLAHRITVLELALDVTHR